MGFPSKVATADLARLLGISVQRVTQLAAEGVLSKGARDQYDAVKSIKAYIVFREHTVASESGRYHGLSKERAAMVRIQRQMAEIELDEKLGNVVLITDAQALIAKYLLIVKNRMLGLGARVAPLLAPAQPHIAERLIYDKVAEILTELHALETYGRTSTNVAPAPENPNGNNGSGKPASTNVAP